MRESIRFKYLYCIIFLGLITACSAYKTSQEAPRQQQNMEIRGSFTISREIAPPAYIQSVQLYAGTDKTSAPVITLTNSSSLTLAFDDVRPHSHTFKVSISHAQKDWGESNLTPNRYLKGVYEPTFSGGQKSYSQNPAFVHYSYSFPNKEFKISKSGNYLLSVFDYRSNKLLFRLPFFISENKGTLETRIEILFAQRNDGRIVEQPFSVYEYPDFVGQPQFDLSFYYVQNQFWGRARPTNLFDTSSPGEIHFHLGRDQSFIGNYEINVLDLHTFRPDGHQIIDIEPGQTPPLVKLRRDVQQFNTMLSQYPGHLKGPSDNRQAKYGEVQFSLVTSKNIRPTDVIYLAGDFNHWVIDQKFRMKYDSTTRLWKRKALIKQGSYTYKYVLLDDNNKINDLALDQGFTNSTQSYLTFVYFQDPELHFDRLLQVNQMRGH